MIGLVEPGSPQGWESARQLIEVYASSLNVDLAFQDIAHELDHLPAEYGPPTGAFLIARELGADLGCVGLRKFSGEAGEIKRLYVLPTARGRGVGRLLADAIVARARTLGYRKVLLDTLPTMKAGRALYASLGFRPVAAYRFNPIAGAEFLEMPLR